MFEGIKGFTSRVASLFARKSKTFRVYMNAMNASPTFTNADYKDFVEEAFNKNPYVYSVITQIATSAAAVPPVLYKIKSGGRVENAVGQYDRKGFSRKRRMRMKRNIVRNVRDNVARKHSLATGAPMHLSRRMAMKALVDEEELEKVQGHELIDLMLHPNPWYQRSYEQFIKSWVMHLEIGGESFLEPVKADGGTLRELYVLPPRDVRVQKGDSGHPIRAFVFSGREKGRYLYSPDPTETEIFYTRYYNPMNPLRGMPPAMAASYAIDVNNEGRTWNLSLLQNGAAHSGVFSSEAGFSEQQVETIKERFNEKAAGAENAGRVIALDGLQNVEFTPISQTVRDMQWGDLNRMSALECAIVWNVPPEVIGDDSSKTYSNYKEARRAFYMEKILPLLEFVYGELNTSVVPLFGDDLLLDYNTEEIDALNDDVNELHERVRKDVQQSLITINEGREALGRDPLDGGDVILVDATKAPLEAVGQQPDNPPPEGEPDGDEPIADDGDDGDDGESDESNLTIRERALRRATTTENGHRKFFPSA